MITVNDARYILSEIRQIPYYEQRIAWLKYQLTEYDILIANATNPICPNGGKDITVNGKELRVKIHGSENTTVSERISEIVTAQEPLEESLKDFEKRYKKALMYKKRLIDNSLDGFVTDFLAGKSYKDLSERYFVSHPYDKMIRLILQEIKAV